MLQNCGGREPPNSQHPRVCFVTIIVIVIIAIAIIVVVVIGLSILAAITVTNYHGLCFPSEYIPPFGSIRIQCLHVLVHSF